MVKNCCVLGCTSNTKRNPAISFFRFPTDTTLASMWLQLIGRPDFKPSQYSVICQLHFTRDDFTSGSHHYPITGIGGQRKRLKTKAIPTQNLNGCTNPEAVAEIQMRAKTMFPQHKISRSSANTMVNASCLPNTNNNNNNNTNNNNTNEAAQLQQLLTSLMPALFGNDSSSSPNTPSKPSVNNLSSNLTSNLSNNLSNNLSSNLSSNLSNNLPSNLTSSLSNSLTSNLTSNISSNLSSNITMETMNSSSSSLSSNLTQTFSNSPQGGYTNSVSTPPFSSTPPTTLQGPIISLPSSLGVAADTSVHNAGSPLSSAVVSEPIMSTPILKKEPVTTTDHTIFKISNGTTGRNLMHNTILTSTNHQLNNNNNGISNSLNGPLNNTMNNSLSSSMNNTNGIRSNGPSSHDDLYTELQNSLLALKQNYSSDSATNNGTSPQLLKTQNSGLVQVQQPIAHEVPMETGNNAYIIDVDTYQRLMETVSQKSEKSTQTEQDLRICSLQGEIKQLKDQLYQYELAFNSLINWTEGSLNTDPVPTPTAPSEPKLFEKTLIE